MPKSKSKSQKSTAKSVAKASRKSAKKSARLLRSTQAPLSQSDEADAVDSTNVDRAIAFADDADDVAGSEGAVDAADDAVSNGAADSDNADDAADSDNADDAAGAVNDAVSTMTPMLTKSRTLISTRISTIKILKRKILQPGGAL
jgi:hypothetical protein